MEYITGYVMTAAGLALCAQLGVSTCGPRALEYAWLKSGGWCEWSGTMTNWRNGDKWSCYWTTAYPNDYPRDPRPNEECIHAYDYPTIGDGNAMDGPGGKGYVCRKSPVS